MYKNNIQQLQIISIVHKSAVSDFRINYNKFKRSKNFVSIIIYEVI